LTGPKPDLSVLLPDDATVAARRDALTAAVKTAGRYDSRRPRSALPLLGAALAVVVAATVFLLASGGASESPTPAYGAQLVRFAESTPLLLLEGPGWRVQNVYEAPTGPYYAEPSRNEGSMEFVTGKEIPNESIRITNAGPPERKPGSRIPVYTKERESGMFPPAVRQRKVELRWFHGSLANSISAARGVPHPHGQSWTKLPVLDTTADVDTRAEFYVNQGGPGNGQMTALWSEDGYVLELKAAVPDLAAFEERLGWLSRVDSQTWLDAMPPNVVKAADHDAAVHEMLRGIPLPNDFTPALVPDEGLTTNRGQVSSAVYSTVACLWFRQWGEARRTGDRAKRGEAERAMGTVKQWPIIQQVEAEGGYPETILKLAASMPSGVWQFGPHRYRLLPKAEGLGCARWGIPVLPRKVKLQRERGVTPPPR
jgi:hypothetical protein